MNKCDKYNEFNSWAKITWTKSDTWRNGYKWSVNECLRLEREFDLLQVSIPEIAKLHNRTMNSIMFKLQAEGLDTFNNLYAKTYGPNYLDEEINNYICQGAIDNDDNDDEYVPNLEEDEDEDLDEDDDDDDDQVIVDALAVEKNDQQETNSYILQQVKSMQKHINNMLSYFTMKNSEKGYYHPFV